MKKQKRPSEPGGPRIVIVRGQRVVLDSELAVMYGVPLRALNQAVKRNARRFPEDFAFRLTASEADDLKSQFVISSLDDSSMERSQIETSGHGGRRSLPWAFTEHGALMAANVLRSERAVEMSVFVVRAFVRQRAQLSLDAEVFRRLEGIDRKLLHHDESLLVLLDIIKSLVSPPKPAPPLPPRPRIGFKP